MSGSVRLRGSGTLRRSLGLPVSTGSEVSSIISGTVMVVVCLRSSFESICISSMKRDGSGRFCSGAGELPSLLLLLLLLLLPLAWCDFAATPKMLAWFLGTSFTSLRGLLEPFEEACECFAVFCCLRELAATSEEKSFAA